MRVLNIEIVDETTSEIVRVSFSFDELEELCKKNGISPIKLALLECNHKLNIKLNQNIAIFIP